MMSGLKDLKFLVAHENFGCGSSREHAPWSILDYGFNVVIAPSFADIFYNNCMKNGLLPIKLTMSEVEELLANGQQDTLFSRSEFGGTNGDRARW